MCESHLAYLSLGTNIGNLEENINTAINLILDTQNIFIKLKSEIIKTKPVDYLDQPDFLNMIILVETSYKPNELLDALKQIEKAMGRENGIPKGPRIMDIDIIMYDDMALNSEHLTIPHSQMRKRKFILDLLNEINPNLIDPLTSKSIKELAEEL
jgi:2-amino-4-hydroxy-6-hydroxymethyldihydropteridine diphosphokinase